jgi:hypothetical protein
MPVFALMICESMGNLPGHLSEAEVETRDVNKHIGGSVLESVVFESQLTVWMIIDYSSLIH